MAIKLPAGLPAGRVLREEGVDVIDAAGAFFPGALRVALLNLMPDKPATELQIARLLGGTGRSIELTLIVPDSYRPKTTPAEHLAAFYAPWSRVRDRRFDGLIVTGAPVETLPFEDVWYWRDLTTILDWAEDHVDRSYYICWAAQAALYHAYGVPKHGLDRKMFGVFEHRAAMPGAALLRGFGDRFPVPVSRHTETRMADLPSGEGLRVLAQSDESGLCLIDDPRRRAVYMFNHLEYDADTLGNEYRRDRQADRPVSLPRHYFPADDPDRCPSNRWSRYGRILFRNWIAQIDHDVRQPGRGSRVVGLSRAWNGQLPADGGVSVGSLTLARDRSASWHGALRNSAGSRGRVGFGGYPGA